MIYDTYKSKIKILLLHRLPKNLIHKDAQWVNVNFHYFSIMFSKASNRSSKCLCLRTKCDVLKSTNHSSWQIELI